MSTSSYINIVASTVVFDASGVPLAKGYITFQPTTRLQLPDVNAQILRSPVKRNILAGSMVGSLQLANTAASSPSHVGFDIRIYDSQTGHVEPYDNVAITPDVNGNWDLAKLQTGQYTEGVPYTLIKGDKGDPGDAAPPTVTLENYAAISGFTAVAASPSGATNADSSDVTKPAIGIASASVLANAGVPVQYAGPLTYNGWNWTVGEPVFVGPGGVLTQAQPGSGYIQAVGMPLSPIRLLIDLEEAVPIT